MKKFLIVFILLILAAGAVFYVGWVQYQVERNEIGVVHTKTVGYLSEPVVSGEFYWTPWRLLPGNVSIITLPADPVTLTLSQSGELPSASIYSFYIQGHPDFSYSMDLSLSFQIRPEHAVDLVKEENISEDTYEHWLDKKSAAIEERALALLLSCISDVTDALSEGEQREFDIDSSTLRNDLEAHFSELSILSLSINSLKLPDLALYVTARESYYQALETQQESLEEALKETSIDRAEMELYLQKLEKYGRVFTEYPALLEYLELHPLESLP